MIVPSSRRNQGMGSLLVRQFLDWADLWQRDVHVAARPIGVGSGAVGNLERLYRFYARHGFMEVDRGITVVYMVRKFNGA